MPLLMFQRRTLRAAARAIGPRPPLAPLGLDEHVCADIERQLKAFPTWYRVGFRLGLMFLELGGPLGGWGLLPFSLLSRERAGERVMALLHSRLAPVRLFAQGLKVLVCLSAYGHEEVEASLGAPRRAWRRDRAELRDALISLSEPRRAQEAQGEALSPPEPLADPAWLEEGRYLSFGERPHQPSAPLSSSEGGDHER